MTDKEAHEEIKRLLIAEDNEIEKRRTELSSNGQICGGLDNNTWCKDIEDKYKNMIDEIIKQID